jgi:hypothetical protein
MIMSGLESLDSTIIKHCNEIIDSATRIKDLEIRDPQTIHQLGTNASRGWGEVTKAARIIDSEGAWGEVESLRAKQQRGPDICLEVSV